VKNIPEVTSYEPVDKKNMEILKIWSEVDHLLSKNLIQIKPALIIHLKNSKRDVAKYLLTGTTDVDTKQDDIRNLVDDMIAEKSKNLKSVRDQIVLLGFAIEAGNKQGLWSLPIPPVPVYVQREKNPFQPDRFKQIRLARFWSSIVLKALNHGAEFSEAANIGCILLSAMSRGGLLHINTVDTLLAQLDKGICVANGRSFIELSLRWRGQDDMETRRWFPDPFTEALILNQSITPSVTAGKRAWPFIRTFFKEAGVERADRPKNMTALIDALTLDLQMKIPPFLVNYAVRGFVSHSIKSNTWRRFQGVVQQESEEVQLADLEGQQETNQMDNSETEDFGETSWGCLIRLALWQSSKPLVLAALHSIPHTESEPPVAKYIIDWAEYLIGNGSKLGRTLTLGVIRSYIGMIAPRIFGLIGEEDFALLNIEAFEEIYSQILEDASSAGMRRKLARALRELHHYLSLKLEAPVLDSSVLGLGDALSPVDANILSIEEYKQTMHILDMSDLIIAHPDLPLIAQIVTTLGFRCGLRRSEVLKLRLIDVHGKVDPEILVRPHATRRLKTKNSTRRLLLTCLLEGDELDSLLSWVDKRRNQERETIYSPYLFSIPGKQYGYVPEELLFPAIHRAMRTATGDNRLRFHHLRHSCASWSLLRLMIADYGMPKGIFDHMPDTYQWLSHSSGSFKQALYRHSLPTRKHVYVVASMLGHSSPGITLEHYIHWCDVMLYHTLISAVAPVDKSLWVKVTAIPQATVYRRLDYGGEQALLDRLRKTSTGRITSILNNPSRVTSTIETGRQNHFPLFARYEIIWKLLYLHSARNMPVEDLAERYGFTFLEASTMIAEATRISKIKGKGRHASNRHRMMTLTSGQRLICPEKPRDAASVRLSEDFTKKLSNLMKTDPDDCVWFLNYYQANAWARSNDIVFKNVTSAARFLAILEKLNMPHKFIRLTWYHGQKHSSLSDKNRRQYWRTLLELPKNRKMESKKINDVRPLGKHGWLGIRLLDYLNKENDVHSSYGYRFTFIMFSIAYAAESLSTEKQLSLIL